jgi:urea transport system permease protein
MRGRLWRWICVGLWVMMASLHVTIHAATTLDPKLATQLTASQTTQRLAAIAALGQAGSPEAGKVLQALTEAKVFVTPDGQVFLDGDPSVNVLTGESVTEIPGSAKRVRLNNRLRRAVQTEVAYAQLFDDQVANQSQAARQLQSRPDPSRLAILQRALQAADNSDVKREIGVAIAIASLQVDDVAVKLDAIEQLGESGRGQFKTALEQLLAKAGDATVVQPESVRQAATIALEKIETQQTIQTWLGNVFFGLSMGSVLLLAALGLAIIFGLMGVINMAHGELLMIGAYSTYLVQSAVQAWWPAGIDFYVLLAIPVAFLITACVGMVLEKTVIRWLYGRPLETLLATWGVSLILIQAVRSIFGAQNVEVANPSWMSGGWQVMGDLVVSYNRIYIFFFALLVVATLWLVLNHTRIGLFVRAITQNRRMANCVGVPTERVDMLAFGLGAGIAGLGGVALSQLGNVGPDLGRTYIVDSFMVVVLGGVGQLAGTVIAALGLGALNKMIEPVSGAVIAKIAILVFIILFIQKRPQGIFAPKGRSAEA